MKIELNDNERKSPKRLIIDIPEEFHAEIKSVAAKKGISINKFVTGVLIRAIREEKAKETDGKKRMVP